MGVVPIYYAGKGRREWTKGDQGTHITSVTFKGRERKSSLGHTHLEN